MFRGCASWVIVIVSDVASDSLYCSIKDIARYMELVQLLELTLVAAYFSVSVEIMRGNARDQAKLTVTYRKGQI